jgi:hypothetical protein
MSIIGQRRDAISEKRRWKFSIGKLWATMTMKWRRAM